MMSASKSGSSGAFIWPEFWNFPPYFTLQPVPETQQKQKELWRELIVAYCRHHRIFFIDVEGSFAPFVNPAINRHLSRDARIVLLDHLVEHGQAKWMDGKRKSRCLVLWKTMLEWAIALHTWAKEVGLRDSVMTLDDLQDGSEIEGTDVEALPREILVQAIKILESQGKARLFKGAASEEGVKFF